jgi:hypothetical protein
LKWRIWPKQPVLLPNSKIQTFFPAILPHDAKLVQSDADQAVRQALMDLYNCIALGCPDDAIDE